MTATLTFDLLDKEGMMAHYRCVKSLDMALCLHRIKETLYKDVSDQLKIQLITSEIDEIQLQELID